MIDQIIKLEKLPYKSLVEINGGHGDCPPQAAEGSYPAGYTTGIILRYCFTTFRWVGWA